MGSHFTNDDLVRESRLEDDYTFEVVERSEYGSYFTALWVQWRRSF